MAGDWIPIRVDLPDCPKVLRLAQALEKPPDEVVGQLIRFWAWAQQHTDSGVLEGISVQLAALGAKVPERLLSVMQNVGWLEVTKNGLRIPDFEQWFSGAAKRRLQSSRRVKRFRNAAALQRCNANVTQQRYKSVTIGEERRGEDSIYNIPPNGGSRLGSRRPPAEGTPDSDSNTEKSQTRDSPALVQVIERLTAAWNALEGIPKIRGWSEKRRRALRVRLQDPTWLDDAMRVIKLIPQTPFLRGENKTGWRANIDWLLKPDSVIKALEGQYEGEQQTLGQIIDPFAGG